MYTFGDEAFNKKKTIDNSPLTDHFLFAEAPPNPVRLQGRIWPRKCLVEEWDERRLDNHDADDDDADKL